MTNIDDVGRIAQLVQKHAGPTTREAWQRLMPRLQAPPAAVPEVEALRAEVERLNAIVNTPQADDFLRAVSTEAEHQRQRWPQGHDEGKTDADWFWLIGYLAGKALHAHTAGAIGKAEHHVITTAAACANWHRAIVAALASNKESE